MSNMKKIFTALAVAVMLALGASACTSAADTASYNLSKDADNFKIQRRIVFYNGITGTYMLVIEGRCALGNSDKAGELSVICQVAPDMYKKHFLGLSANVTYFVEQLEPAQVDDFHYKVVFRPETLGPDIDMQTSDQRKPR